MKEQRCVNCGRRPGEGHDKDCSKPKYNGPRPELAYHYRGQIECGSRYEWRDGYSANDVETGGVLYPWSTRADCRKEAKRRGFKAVFYRDGERE